LYRTQYFHIKAIVQALSFSSLFKQLPIIMLYHLVTALSFAATVPLAAAYPITGDGVNCRSGPGTSHAVVKSYPKGHEISIVCQAAGNDVKGDNLWDKTSDGCYVADYYVKTGSTGYVTKHCDGGSDGGSGSGSGNLPGLTATQSSHAHKIIDEAKKEGLGRQGCLAGIATALVEVSSRSELLESLVIVCTDAYPL
jgi:uncharacterized protein YraI